MAGAIPYELRKSAVKDDFVQLLVDFVFPSRVLLHKVMIRHNDGGDHMEFTVEGYSFDPMFYLSTSDPTAYSDLNPSELFNVFPIQVSDLGAINYFPETPLPFFSHGGPGPTGAVTAQNTNPQHLFLNIMGPGALGTFDVLVGCCEPLT